MFIVIRSCFPSRDSLGGYSEIVVLYPVIGGGSKLAVEPKLHRFCPGGSDAAIQPEDPLGVCDVEELGWSVGLRQSPHEELGFVGHALSSFNLHQNADVRLRA